MGPDGLAPRLSSRSRPLVRRTFGLLAAAALFAAAGCGGGPDGVLKEMIVDMNAFAEAIEKKEPTDKVDALRKKYEATAQKWSDLKLSEDEATRVMDRHKEEYAKALMRLGAAQMKAGLG